MEQLDLLEQNIGLLLARYRALEQEVQTLRDTTVRQREEILQSHAELTEIKQQYRRLQTAHSLVGDDSQRDKARQEINYLLSLVERALEANRS